MASPTASGGVKSTPGATNPQTVTIATANVGDVVLIGTTGNATPSGVPTSTNLTFTQRGSTVSNGTIHTALFSAPVNTALTNEVVTVNYTSTVFNTVWGVVVGGPSLQFDPHSGLPSTSTSSTDTYSSTNGNALAIAVFTESSTSNPGPPTGFTSWTTPAGDFGNASTEALASPQSNTTVTFPGSGTWAGLVDVIEFVPIGIVPTWADVEF